MSESALVRAVRDQIRTVSGFDVGPPDQRHRVNVEWDELAPATAGDTYIIITSGGVEAGPTHNPSGGVIDKLYHVDVSIALKAPKRPRDRRREMWIDLTKSFETHQKNIENVIDFRYAVLTAANAFILTEYSSNDGFIEPLKFADVGLIRRAPASIFAGVGEPTAALIRKIRFRSARRIENRS